MSSSRLSLGFYEVFAAGEIELKEMIEIVATLYEMEGVTGVRIGQENVSITKFIPD